MAGRRLAGQLQALDIPADADHPLFVYLPCGVGGGPGGMTYGIKTVFGKHVHCFFAEPTSSPCTLLGMHTGKHEAISVFDIGHDNKTADDGLAVGRPSSLVGKVMEGLLEGIFTVSNEEMYRLLALTAELEGINLEPSALAGVKGILYASRRYGADVIRNATHIAWCTGGAMVPEAEMQNTYKRERICSKKK